MGIKVPAHVPTDAVDVPPQLFYCPGCTHKSNSRHRSWTMFSEVCYVNYNVLMSTTIRLQINVAAAQNETENKNKLTL